MKTRLKLNFLSRRKLRKRVRGPGRSIITTVSVLFGKDQNDINDMHYKRIINTNQSLCTIKGIKAV